MSQRTPITEQRRLVRTWRHSHKSMSAFALSAGIPESTFWRWTRKFSADGPHELTAPAATPEQLMEPIATSTFIEITPVSDAAPTSVRLRVEGRRSVEVTFDSLPEPSWFGTVLREVVAC